MSKRKNILNKTGGICVMCSAELSLDYNFDTYGANYAQIDHLVPKSMGGGNNIDNLFPICKGCNSYKCNTFVDVKIQNIFKFNEDAITKIKNEALYEIKNGAISKDEVSYAIDLVIEDIEASIVAMNTLKECVL